MPEFAIYLGSSENPSSSLRSNVLSISVTEDLGKAAEYSFVVSDNLDAEKGTFQWLDNKDLQPGREITIKMGYANQTNGNGLPTTLIKDGPIKTVNISGFSQSDPPKLTITGYDRFYDWLDKVPSADDIGSSRITGSEIVQFISNNAGMDSEVEDTKEFPTSISGSRDNKYGAILLEQIKKIGWEFFSSRNVIYYINPRKNRESFSVFKWGKNIIRFNPTINIAGMKAGVKISSSSNKSKEPIKAEASVGDEDAWETGGDLKTLSDIASEQNKDPEEITDLNIDDKEEASARAKSELNRRGDDLISAKVEIVGNTKLQVGKMVQLEGLGKKFSGKYFITSVTNEISSNGYRTKFKVRKNTIGGM